MIGLLTSNFAFYHDVVNELKKRDLPFISLSFTEKIPPNVDVVITSERERERIDFGNVVIWKSGESIENLVDKALIYSSGEDVKIVFGIDPGDNIGIAIFGNRKLIRSLIASSPEQAANFIKEYVEDIGAKEVVVKIGNGARLIRNRIINRLIKENIRMEIVDEAAIPCVDDDEVAASTIALAEGREIKDTLSVEPKEGEIREMQRLSRIKSRNITISKELARKVLRGEMKLEDAIEIQRGKNQA
ncbi:MAG TPA: hypothetical protein ENL42_01080 [Thermoplasmatales archaeon]|nr:hypothetical protein [Thermoplasmatales archaeon]